MISNIFRLASLLDCKVSSFPMKYLGFPLGVTFENKAIWDEKVEKIEKRQAGWLETGVFIKGGLSHSSQEYSY